MSEQVDTNQPTNIDIKTESPQKKTPWVKWLLIYAIAGLLIYGLVYYFVFYKKTSQKIADKITATQTQENMNEKSIVVLTDEGFSPETLTVKTGTEVSWLNNSGKVATVNSSVHPTHLDYPPLNLGEFENGESLSLIFDTPGTYEYHNHLDASQTGTVIVQ